MTAVDEGNVSQRHLRKAELAYNFHKEICNKINI